MPTVHRYHFPGEMPLVAPMKFLTTHELLKMTTVFFFPFSNLLIYNSGESALRLYYHMGPLDSEMWARSKNVKSFKSHSEPHRDPTTEAPLLVLMS